jgi:hypothetical protein
MATVTLSNDPTADLQKLARELPRRSRQVLRALSLRVMRRIKGDFPVKSGRARASWGKWSAGDLRELSLEAGPHEAIYEVSGDTVTQGSAVPYIEALNAGHSQQAPAGFIDKRALEGELELTEALSALMDISGVGGDARIGGGMDRTVGTD